MVSDNSMLNGLCSELDYDSIIPLYHQLKELILVRIESGDWPEGTAIPSENELTRNCRVSRATVRRAMELLVHEGYLEKRRGTGTFVRQPKIEEQLPRLKSFTEEMAGRNARKKVFSAEYVEPPARIQKILKLFPGEKVLYLKRLMIVDEVPIGILYEYVSGRFGLKVDEDYSGSLYKILENHDVTLKEADQIIEASTSTEEEISFMGLNGPFSTLLIKRTVYATNGDPVEYVIGVYHGDRYRYQLKLMRDNAPTSKG
jgi:GntR family transcriptional regulator